jgi:hypothetical protein
LEVIDDYHQKVKSPTLQGWLNPKKQKVKVEAEVKDGSKT